MDIRSISSGFQGRVLPLSNRDLLVNMFPKHAENIEHFFGMECDIMLTLSQKLTTDQSEVVLVNYEYLLRGPSHLFLDLIILTQDYIDQAEQIFQRVAQGFSLSQSIFMEVFPIFQSQMYLTQVRELSDYQCLRASCKNSDFRSDPSFYHLSYLMSFSIQESQWALAMLAKLEQVDKIGEVIELTSDGIYLHQALILVQFPNECEKEMIDQLLYPCQSARVFDLVLDGFSLGEAIHIAVSPNYTPEAINYMNFF